MTPFLPMNQLIFDLSLSWFSKIASVTYGLIGVFLTIKFAFLILQMAHASDYFETIKGAASYLGMTLAFPILAKLLIFGASDIANKIIIPSTRPELEGIGKYFEIIFASFPLIQFVWKIADILVLNIAWAFHTVLISVLIAISPLIFFGAMMTDFSTGVRPYFTTLGSLCLWPILWNILGALSVGVLSSINSAPITSFCFYIVFHMLQLLSPIFCFSLLKNLNLDMGSRTAMKLGGKLWN